MLTPYVGLSTQRTVEEMVRDGDTSADTQAETCICDQIFTDMNNQDFNVPRERHVLNMIKSRYILTC